ncbi:MAG: type IV pilus assembly protein PilM [Candidatus Omnitrophica bacterium]|nr:type IV pilus assembly protein PilM [Candidatus Omnitrophota bacterium]
MGIFKKDYIVGLDIGSSSIKLAQFVKRQDGLYLVKADLKEIKTTGNDTLDEGIIVGSLNEFLRDVNIKRSKFVVAINCPKTCVRTVVVPYMPKNELQEGIRLAAKNYFPFPVDDVLMDFEILGEILEKGVRKYQLSVAVSPKTTVDRYIALLRKAGIRPSLFIPLPLALQKVIERACPEEKDVKAALDIGECFTELAIFTGKNLVFCRKIPVAGSDITRAMTDVLASDIGKTSLSMEDAERLKREHGIPREGDARIIENKISTQQILSMVRHPLENMANEIDRCFDYYREESGGGTIDSMLLFGGGAFLRGLPEFLTEELGIEVKLGNPLKNLKIKTGKVIEKKGISNRLATSIGAALSFAKGMNLLPVEVKEETKRTVKRVTAFGAVTAVILSLILLYVGMKIQLTAFQRRIGAAKREYISIMPQLKLAETQAMADKTLTNEPYWEDVFMEISNVIPGNIYLTELNMKDGAKDGAIEIKGIVDIEEGEGVLSDFILALEKGIFKNVKLITTKDIEDTKSRFEIKCRAD